MLGEVWLSTIDLSIVIGGMIIVLLMLRSFLYKKIALKWWYGIWLVLAIRLLIPFNWGAQMNLIQIGESLFKNYQQEEILAQSIDASQAEALVGLTTEKDSTNEKLSSSLTSNDSINKGKLEHQIEDLKMGDNSKYVESTLKLFLSYFWLIGSTLFLSYHLVLYLSFRKACKRWNQTSRDQVINQVFKEICRELHITKPIEIQVCKKIDSPMVMGYWRPNILIPSKKYEEQELYFILKHELLHYKYGDLWYKLLLVSVRGIHWFNPLVHIMAKYAEEDLEVVCDSRVLKGEVPETKKSYMEVILKVADSSHQKSISLSTQFRGNKQTLKQRFEVIVNGHKKKKGLVTFIMVTCIGLVSGCVGITREVAKPLEKASIEDIGEKDLKLESQQPTGVIKEETEDKQVLMISGYEIRVPEQWTIQNFNQGDSEGQDVYSSINWLYKGNQRMGGVRLINNKISMEDAFNVFGLPVKGREIEQTSIQGYRVPLIETQYKKDGKTSYIQYAFYDLPNPSPYGYALFFDLEQVNKEEINQILSSFKIPDLGENLDKLPQKNRKPLTLEEAKTSATYGVGLKDGTEEAFNLDKLDNFIDNQKKGIPGQLDVLTYIETENGLVIKDWYYIIFDGQVARSFGYYMLDDGNYTYDNMPIVFSKILKKYYPQESIITYRLVGEDGDEENTMRFFQVSTTKSTKDSFETTKEEKATYILLK